MRSKIEKRKWPAQSKQGQRKTATIDRHWAACRYIPLRINENLGACPTRIGAQVGQTPSQSIMQLFVWRSRRRRDRELHTGLSWLLACNARAGEESFVGIDIVAAGALPLAGRQVRQGVCVAFGIANRDGRDRCQYRGSRIHQSLAHRVTSRLQSIAGEDCPMWLEQKTKFGVSSPHYPCYPWEK